MLKEYFQKREYIYIYLMKICYGIASSLLTIFSLVVLYQNGMSITTIILMQCLEFGLMGLLTPACTYISKKSGIGNVVILANIFRILTCYILLNNPNTNILILVLLMASSGALANPLENMIISKHIDEKHSGKVLSLKNICNIIGVAISSIIVGLGIISENTTILFIVITTFYILDMFFTKKLDFKQIIDEEKTTNTFKYILEEKDEMKQVYYVRAFLIAERNFIPLYIYIVLNDFAQFTVVIVISILVQLVTLILIGRLTDKDTKKSLNLVCRLKRLVSFIFLICRTPYIISTNKLAFDNIDKLYETTRQSITGRHIKNINGNNQILPSVYEMCLCFSEVIVFYIFAKISEYVGENIFIVIFAMSMIANYIINIKLSKIWKKDNQTRKESQDIEENLAIKV